jgi:hypothetical protein
VSIQSGPAKVQTPDGTETGEQALDFMMINVGETLTGGNNVRDDNTLAATTTLAGDTWKQHGIISDDQEGVMLGDFHTANNHIFIIVLKAKARHYNQVYSTLFKPLLDTFRFGAVG